MQKLSEMAKLLPEEYKTDKFTDHCYQAFYDAWFGERKMRALKVLEIGVRHGGFVRLVHDYLPKAKVIGIDNKQIIAETSSYSRLKLYNFNAYNIENWLNIPKQDIIIDDGSHLPGDQAYVLNHMQAWLKEGGIIVIEDIMPHDVQKVINAFSGDKNRLKVYDWHEITGRADDIMIVFS